MTEVTNNVSAKLNATSSNVNKKNQEVKKQETVFNQDSKLTKEEKKALRNDGGLTRHQIKDLSRTRDGVEFLEQYGALGEKYTNADDLKSKRRELALKYFAGDGNYDTIDDAIKADLRGFGISNAEVEEYLKQGRLNARRSPKTSIIPDPALGNTTVTPARIKSYNTDGKISLDVWQGDKMDDENADPICLYKDAKTGYFEKNGVYYSYNAENNVLTDVTSKVQVPETPSESAQDVTPAEEAVPEEKAEAPKFSDVFAKNKTVNIDETGSKQCLTAKEQWSTNIVVPRKAEYTEAGLPKQVGIELPSDYGSKDADGVGQKRYQVLNLVDEENKVYSDKTGIRQFQMEVTEDGIKLNLYNPDDAKVKSFLDKNTEAVQQKAQESGLNDNLNKMKIDAKEEAAQIMEQLSDRNTSWETYTQIGTDIGHITGAHGLLEKLVDEQDVTGLKTYNDLKPAIDGLMARVPESVTTSPEYQAVQDAIAKLAENPDAEIKSSWTEQIGGDTDIRKLDRALMNLAKTHLASSIQGANHANNAYLVGGNGSVVISPDREKGIWNTDAKFNIGGKDYYLYQERALIDRTVDFQDVVEHKDDGTRDKLSLIRNEVTGNNRHGEIKFNAERAQDETFYFKADGGVKMPVIVEDGIAYVQNGDQKVPVYDILNGKAQMPQ